VDAAALAGCNRTLVNSSTIAVLPPQEKHANRALTLGPDGKLYYTVAAPFDLGECIDPYCSIWRMDKDGSNRQRVVRNVRNAAGYTWLPSTGELLFTGMERDGMGNEAPDDVLAAIQIDDAAFSSGSITNMQWPVCHWQGSGPAALREPGPGQAISDTNVTWGSEGGINRTLSAEQQAAQAANCSASAPRPLQALGPHVAPLGVLYWAAPAAGEDRAWPAEYDNSLFIAEHGSWNRTPSVGYRIVNVQLSDDGRTVTDHTVFADGWLTQADEHWGRPVGLLRLPDSSLLIGDDYGFTIYRVYSTGAAPAAAPAPAADAVAAGAAAGPAPANSAAAARRGAAAAAAWCAAAAPAAAAAIALMLMT
jgi:glucose/arabinose dehydrogenase